MKVVGRAHLLPDAIDTDQIIPGRFLNVVERDELGEHALAGYDEQFADHLEPGDLVVAGTNFGLGSSRETAAVALKQAGVGAVVAESFARIFYRNSVNVGLPIARVSGVTEHISDHDTLELDLARGTVRNLDEGTTLETDPLPERLQRILKAGGLDELRNPDGD